MYALSVGNPWAWAIIHGPKRIENRSWRTHYRGTLLIHASKSRRFLKAEWPLPDAPPQESAFVFGALIGQVELIDCVPVAEVTDDPFASGPWCLVLANPRPFASIPWKGQVGLFHVPESVVGL